MSFLMSPIFQHTKSKQKSTPDKGVRHNKKINFTTSNS